MKKALSIVLVLTMMMSLTACGDKTDKNVDDTQANTETSQTEQVEQTENVLYSDDKFKITFAVFFKSS